MPGAARLAGQRVRFTSAGVAAPHPLGCGQARYEYLLSPAEGLFQGALPEPAARAARRVGIVRLPVLTLRVSCDSGAFDYHFASRNRMLIGLDNVIWPLTRSSGEATPEHVVLDMLHSHMTHEMGFSRASVARKRHWLTAELRAAIAAYFRRPMPKDEVPPIDGDPFSDSQEYPTRFVAGRASIEGDRAVLPVRMGDEFRTWGVEFLLRRIGGRWRVDDLRYEHGGSLRASLKP